jgi:hypothetical protein
VRAGFVQFLSEYYRLLFGIETFFRPVKFFDLDERSLTWLFVLMFGLRVVLCAVILCAVILCAVILCAVILKLLYRSANLVTWRDFVREI